MAVSEDENSCPKTFLDHIASKFTILELICFLLLFYPIISLPLFYCLSVYFFGCKKLSSLSNSTLGLFCATPFFFPVIAHFLFKGLNFFTASPFSFSTIFFLYIILNLSVFLSSFLAGYLIKRANYSRLVAFFLLFVFILCGFFFSQQLSSPPQSSVAYSTSTPDISLDTVPKTVEITGSLSRTVYWTPGGGSYHFSQNCTSLKRSKTILTGTLQEALDEGKTDPCNLCAGGS